MLIPGFEKKKRYVVWDFVKARLSPEMSHSVNIVKRHNDGASIFSFDNQTFSDTARDPTVNLYQMTRIMTNEDEKVYRCESDVKDVTDRRR